MFSLLAQGGDHSTEELLLQSPRWNRPRLSFLRPHPCSSCPFSLLPSASLLVSPKSTPNLNPRYPYPWLRLFLDLRQGSINQGIFLFLSISRRFPVSGIQSKVTLGGSISSSRTGSSHEFLNAGGASQPHLLMGQSWPVPTKCILYPIYHNTRGQRTRWRGTGGGVPLEEFPFSTFVG